MVSIEFLFMYMSTGKREIMELAVYCDNKDRNCEWSGTIETLSEHVEACDFSLVACPYDCEDEDGSFTFVMKKDLSDHVTDQCPNRPYDCEHCQEKGTFASITKKHYRKCQKICLSCSNEECSATVERRHLKRHLESECDFTIVPCKYRRIGCGVQFQRKDLAAHESDDQVHLEHALKTVVKLETRVDELEAVVCFKSDDIFSFKVNNYQWRLENKKTFYSPKFLSHPNGQQFCVLVLPNGLREGSGTHIWIGLCAYLRNKPSSSWTLRGTLKVVLLNQLADENHHIVNTNFEARSREYASLLNGVLCKKLPTYISHSELAYNSAKNVQYLKDDCLQFKVLVRTSDYKPWLLD